MSSPTSDAAHGVRPCPTCRTEGGRVVHRVARLPAHSCLVVRDAAEARGVGMGTLDLVLCERCGHLANRGFDESLVAYDVRYEDSQAFSGTFTAYAEELARDWVDRWHLAGRTVVEVGAGRGDFARMLAEAGAGRVVAQDPTIHPDRFAAHPRVSPLATAFRRPADLPPADAVAMRHVLEHVEDPRALLLELREALDVRPDVPVLAEVPDSRRILREGAFWDVYHEHCSYYVEETVRLLFASSGFEVAEVERRYDDQYLVVAALPTGVPHEPSLDPATALALTGTARAFAERVADQVDGWRRTVRAAAAAGQDVVVWGAGSKGTAFLAALDEDAGAVSRVVDVNPYLSGAFISGTGHPIVAPADLERRPTDLVVVMNPVYLREISQAVSGLSPRARLLGLGALVPAG
ncbi:MAG: class I SAM-dependent methyltransferase [Terrabacter sp.]